MKHTNAAWDKPNASMLSTKGKYKPCLWPSYFQKKKKKSESPTCLINSCDFFQPQKLICKIFICTERAKGSISASWSQTSGPCGGNLRSPCSAMRPQGLWSSYWEGSGTVTSLLETHGALTSKKSCHAGPDLVCFTCGFPNLFKLWTLRVRSMWTTCWIHAPGKTLKLYSLLNSKVVYFSSAFTLGAKLMFTDPSGVVETMQSSLQTINILQLTFIASKS